MNRFEYLYPDITPHETVTRNDRAIKLYDGDVKTNFEGGEVILTSHRIIWRKQGDDGHISLQLTLKYIVFFEEETPGALFFTRSKKVVLHLSEPAPDKLPGPIDHSTFNFVKLSFKEGLDPNFVKHLSYNIMTKLWETVPLNPSSPQGVSTSRPKGPKPPPPIKTRTGIIGIERSLQEQQKATDQSITLAFQDLKKLIEMAKDMVSISKTISAKIRERQGDITEDETIRFKSYLMSLGIDDPVTRDAYKSSNEYFKHLAKEIVAVLEEPIREVGGMMALADVYCRINRARGLELVSPEDLLNACRQLDLMNLPLVFRTFDSGVMVLQSRSHQDSSVVEMISDLLHEKGSVTAEELAQSDGISIMLARERLLVAEKYGGACRDDSIEGLRFYPNLFLEQEA